MRTTVLYRGVILAAAGFALAGCASMGKDECLVMDWRTVGYEDGTSGRGIEALANRRKACARHGVMPDLDAYRIGRDEGLQEFCQPDNGFRVGTSGRGYGGVCPAHLVADFTEAYDTGRTLWRLENRLSDAVAGIASRRAEIVRIDEILVSSGLIVMNENSTTEERAQALLNSKTLTERRGRLLVEIKELEYAIPGYETELADYRSQLGYHYY